MKKILHKIYLLPLFLLITPFFITAQNETPYQENINLEIQTFLVKKDSYSREELISELRKIIDLIHKRILYLTSLQKQVSIQSNQDLDNSLSNSYKNDPALKQVYYINKDFSLRAFQNHSISNHDEYLWGLSRNVFSDEIIEDYVNVFKLYNGESEEEQFFVASVSETIKDFWALNINSHHLNISEESSNEDFFIFYETLVHELSHILSLNTNELSSYSWENCPTYFVEYSGCLKENSALYLFKEEFWEKSHINHSKKAYEILEEEGVEAFGQELEDYFYTGTNEDDFYSPYSTSSFIEDFAESYLVYVFLDNFVEKDTSKIYIQKAKFMDNFPELKRQKDYILENIYIYD